MGRAEEEGSAEVTIDIRFTDRRDVATDVRKGVQIDVLAKIDGNGAIDRKQLQEIRQHVHEYLAAQLPKIIKEGHRRED